MTKAICWRCGNLKHGAFNPCPSCGLEPLDDEDILISLYLTDHFQSDEDLQDFVGRIRSGQLIHIPPDMRVEMFPMLLEVKRISGIGLRTLNQSPPGTKAKTTSFLAYIRRFSCFVSSRQPLSALFYHAWRMSLIVVLVLSIASAIHGDFLRLWNPIAFLVTQIGVGYSFASLFLGMSSIRLKYQKCRFYLFAAIVSTVFLFVSNMPCWSLPFARAELTPFVLALWAFSTGLISALRGDFDAAT